MQPLFTHAGFGFPCAVTVLGGIESFSMLEPIQERLCSTAAGIPSNPGGSFERKKKPGDTASYIRHTHIQQYLMRNATARVLLTRANAGVFFYDKHVPRRRWRFP